MKRWMVIFLLCLSYFYQYGQISDDFQDGDLSNNPVWSGDTQNFIVNDLLQLQLQAAEAGSSEIYLQNSYLDSIEWNFYFKLDFAPSTSNQLRIYLWSSHNEIDSTNAYYLEVGESGSSDALKFFRQEGKESVLLGTGTMGALGNSIAEATIQVLRHGDGFWEIKADYSGGPNPQTELEVFDNIIETNQDAFFILSCNYTDSRKDKFFFDDISITEIIPDTEAPSITGFELVSSNFLSLFFNEPLDESTAETLTNYQSNPSLSLVTASYVESIPYGVNLLFSENLSSGIIYQMDVSNIEDLNGNRMNTQRINFSLIEEAEPGDLLINEILFDPYQDAEDFIEIYNRSEKFIGLDKLTIANLDKDERVNIQAGIEISPNGYLAFSPDIDALEEHYVILDPEALISQALPSLNNESGNVSLLIFKDGMEIVLDSVDYLESQHFSLIDDTEGVSLERIDVEGDSNNPENWHSAASVVGFATPGYRNSQFIEGAGSMEDQFSLSKKVFSPNFDGHDDLLFINFSLGEVGFIANMKIFNSRGRLIKDLAKNSLLPTSGFVKWDGTTDEGRIAPIGIYIIWVELFNPSGTTEQFTLDCVLAQQLN